jgi:hypothetical protein
MSKQNKEQTLDELTAIYRHRGPARAGHRLIMDFLDEEDDEGLSDLLRDYEEEGIDEQWEIKGRDDIDYLFEYYSVLAIGIVANVLPPRLNEVLSEEINTILAHPSVKPYYQSYYPLWLPRLLLHKNKKSLVENIPYAAAYPLFMQVIDLVSQRVKDDTIETFLWFLDGGSTEDYDMDDVIKILENPAAFKKTLQKKRLDDGEKALRGMINYFAFMDEFYNILEKLNKYKLLQSAVWHLEGYWFKHVKEDLLDSLRKCKELAYEQLRRSEDPQEVTAYQQSIQDFIGKVKKLTSTTYSKPLMEALKRRS